MLVVLTLCILIARRPRVSVGLRIPTVRIPKHLSHICSDPNRVVFVRLTRDGQMWISSTVVAPDRLTAIIGLIMENRPDRIVYVSADSQVSYSQFVDLLGKIAGASPNLRIAVLSEQLQRDLEQGHGYAFCELEWPLSDWKTTIN